MLICPTCNRTLEDDVTYWQCFCGTIVNKQNTAKEINPETVKTYKLTNQWIEIHKYLATYIQTNTWNEEKAIEYYNIWVSKIPGCCIGNFLELVKEFPINWSTAEEAFYSFWYLHNEVSYRHAGRPTITLKKAKELYNVSPSLPEKT